MSKGISVIDIGTTGVRVLVAKVTEGREPQIITKADVVCKNAIKNMKERDDELFIIGKNDIVIKKVKTKVFVLVLKQHSIITEKKMH